MGMKWYASFALLLLAAHFVAGLECDDVVPFTPVIDAQERLAVCLDGSSAGYYISPGSENGAKNWLLYMRGGGWCSNSPECENKTTSLRSTVNDTIRNFNRMLSGCQDINPDFYSWNRVYIMYCDQSSFLGDTEILDRGKKFQFRGSRIFYAVVEDLLGKGMNSAENALLAGESAGGLATILHCDGFRARLPSVGRVKCLTDAGFFIRAEDLPRAHFRDQIFASVVTYHNISRFLPTSCTSKIDPSLCLFPEYLVGDVQTPLFILNSAFDTYQLRVNLVPQSSPEYARWKNCIALNYKNCSAADNNLLKDFGKTFVNTIRKIPENPSRGVYIHPCLTHSVTTVIYNPHADIWNPKSTFRMGNMTLREAVGNWYFDRGSINLIEDINSPSSHC